MNVYVVGGANPVQLDYEQLSRSLQDVVSSASADTLSQSALAVSAGETVAVEAVAEKQLATLSLKANDIVFLGFGFSEDSELLSADIEELVSGVRNKGAQAVLCTALPYFHTDDPDLAFMTQRDMQVLYVARQLRLKVLDLFHYAMSWYQRTGEQEHSEVLETLPGKDNVLRFGATSADMLCGFVKSWITRRYFAGQMFDDYFYGASMYPEMWSEDTNTHDMEHAHEIGMNAVRIGEFFWSKLEPEDGVYDMTYLENLLDRYEEHSLKVVLGIPSPTPPRWFTVKHPEARIVNADGTVEEHGSRQHVCTNNPDFRRKVYELTYRIAQVVRKHDNVVAIQLDNEFKCHVDRCYCETCARLWPRWLKSTYSDVDTMNEKWGTNIWSERYGSFDDVVMPTTTPFAHNSGLDYAFRTFTSDTLNEFASGVSQILLSETTVPLTHNTSTNFNLRNYDLFNQLDVVGFDTYPNSKTPWMFPMNLALWRNVIPGNEFMLLETCASHVGYTGNYMLPYPAGFLETEAFLGYASGLKSFLYWLYRGQAYGVEQPHSAVVTAAGTPDLGYGDVLESQRSLEKYKPFMDSTHIVRSKIAMVYSDEARRAYNVENGGIYNFKSMVTEFYHAVTSRGISLELIQENADFNDYSCVLVPFVRAVSPELLTKMKEFSAAGGKLILGPMTGDRTEEMSWNLDNGLGAVGQWLGIDKVVQYLSADPRTEAAVTINGEMEAFTGLVTLFEPKETLEGFVVSSSVSDGRTALARHGNVIYLGGIPADSSTGPFWDALVDREIRPFDADDQLMRVSEGVFKFRRENEKEIQLYIANMCDHDTEFNLNREATDVDGNRLTLGNHHLGKFQYTMLSFIK